MMTGKRRQFVSEVGSVVLGVLIALGIGEAADALRWKYRVENSMEAIRYELSESHFNLVERLAYQNCLDKRIVEIGTILTDARGTGVLPELRIVGKPASRLFKTAAFDVAKSEGVPLHMERAQAHSVSTAYEITDVMRGLSEQERRSWGTLQLMEGPGGPVSDSLLSALLEAWVDAKTNASLLNIAAQQGSKLLADVGARVEYDADVPNHAAFVLAVQKRNTLCRPINGGDDQHD